MMIIFHMMIKRLYLPILLFVIAIFITANIPLCLVDKEGTDNQTMKKSNHFI